MTLKEVGGIYQTANFKNALLSPDWHLELSNVQAAAYVRYQYIRLNEHVIDFDAPAHTQIRRKWDGGKDNAGVSHKSVWPKAVDAIRKNGAHPGAWVASRFSGVAAAVTARPGGSVPPTRPPSLYDYNALIIYDEYCKRFNETFKAYLNVATGVIATRLKEMAVYNLSADDRNFYVLCDEAYVTASPFLRHCLASAVNCPRAALKYLEPAAIDYEAQQALYDAAIAKADLANFVSDRLKTKVVDIRKHWMTYYG